MYFTRNFNSCVVGLPIWLFWSQILKFWLFFEHLWLFWEMKNARKFCLFQAYFQSDRLGSGKTLPELHIHYKFLATRVYCHAGCTKYCENFTVALKMIYDIDQTKCTTVYLRGKNMLLNIGLVLYRCYLPVLMSILCVFVHVLIVYTSKLLSAFFCTRSVFFWWRQVGNPFV